MVSPFSRPVGVCGVKSAAIAAGVIPAPINAGMVNSGIDNPVVVVGVVDDEADDVVVVVDLLKIPREASASALQAVGDRALVRRIVEYNCGEEEAPGFTSAPETQPADAPGTGNGEGVEGGVRDLEEEDEDRWRGGG